MNSAMTNEDSGPINRAATFHPSRNDDELPAIEIGGVLVFAYVDAAGTVRVTVDTESPDPDVFGEGLPIEVRLNVNNDTVFDQRVM
jgi:hypothetical protein